MSGRMRTWMRAAALMLPVLLISAEALRELVAAADITEVAEAEGTGVDMEAAAEEAAGSVISFTC